MIKRVTENVNMRDGIQLSTDIYLPESTGRYPVVLARTPYGKRNLGTIPKYLSKHGYAVVVQDVRGAFASEGNFIPFINEQNDGLDTVEWILDQPWSNGTIGLLGMSYLAAAVLPLIPYSRAVKTLVSAANAARPYDLVYPAGILQLHWALPWALVTAKEDKPDTSKLDWDSLYRTLPLRDAGNNHDSNLWHLLVAHEGKDDLWKQTDRRSLLEKIDIPILHIAGLFDFMLGPTLEIYSRLVARKVSSQRLVLGPWDHYTMVSGSPVLGDTDFGTSARSRFLATVVDWFDHTLKTGGTAPQGGCRVFITGSREWMEFSSWPPSSARERVFYLERSESSETGHLSEEEPDLDFACEYTYDPADPVPTVGGPIWPFREAGLTPGPLVQWTKRVDILEFKSQPFTRDFVICGPVKTVLYVGSSAPKTHFTAKLVDISPDGTARIVQDGIAEYEQGMSVVEIDMTAACHAFLSGHRLGLHISSSNFPKYARSLNIPGSDLHSKSFRMARQQVLVGRNNPSRLVLAVTDD